MWTLHVRPHISTLSTIFEDNACWLELHLGRQGLGKVEFLKKGPFSALLVFWLEQNTTLRQKEHQHGQHSISFLVKYLGFHREVWNHWWHAMSRFAQTCYNVTVCTDHITMYNVQCACHSFFETGFNMTVCIHHITVCTEAFSRQIIMWRSLGAPGASPDCSRYRISVLDFGRVTLSFPSFSKF